MNNGKEVKGVKKAVSNILDKLGFILAACVIFAALLVSIARLLTPVLMEHRADFEKLASDQLGRPVMIREIQIRWHGYEPEVSLEGITILDPETQAPRLAMERLEVDFNIWRSLWLRKAFIQSLTVTGIDLTINHLGGGQFEVGKLGAINMRDRTTGQAVHADLIFNWIFTQPLLALKDIHVHYIPAHFPERSITLKMLLLKNSPTHHVLDGSGTLNQELPVKLDIHLGWDGDIRKLPEANGEVYLYFEGLSLPQWFSKYIWNGLQITQGLASTKLWMSWNHGEVYKVQNTFEIYNLSLYSNVTKNAEIINRISGNVGWKIDGNKQVFAGDGIYIDLPNHLWPATAFTVNATTNAAGDLVLNGVNFTYLDIADATRFAILTSLLPDATRQTLAGLNLKGEIQDFKTTLPATLILPTSLADLSGWVLSGKIQNFNMNAWKDIPEITHFSGGINWKDSSGNITLNSTQTVVNLTNYFNAPLNLANLTGTIKLARASDGTFTINTSNLHLDNADLTADIKTTLSLPTNDTPTVDINAKYSVINAAHLAAYIPEKILDPDLGKWLNNAFVSGNISDGIVTIQGNLKDFPFVPPAAGKFLVTGQVNDLDFNFAPDWPHLTHTNGVLTFAGSSMVAAVSSAQLLNVPIKNIRGEIPYLGPDAPQIINVDGGTINCDLSDGLSFIRQSPLQKTIGKDLAAMTLNGPMQLKLTLSIPAKKPENATVLGVVTTTNAVLALPTWKIKLDKLTGAFTFTEDSLTASNMGAELFGVPAVLGIDTIKADAKQSNQVRVNLASSLSVDTLQNWLNLDFNNIIQGSMAYQIQILLSAANNTHANDQLILSSNLQGMALNVPAPYGKKAPEQKDFQVIVDLVDTKLLKIKFLYAKMLSAALSFQKDNQQLKLYGGEVKLGTDTAAWQTSPGILLSGQVPQLDVGVWRDYFATFPGVNKTNARANFKLLRGIDLSANLLNVMNVQLHKTRVQASINNSAWNIKINSDEIGGELTLPFNTNENMITGHFDHLTLSSKMAAQRANNLDPREVPAMQLEIDDVRYDDMKFGHVNLNLQPDNSGLLIKELNVNEPLLQITSAGSWTRGGTQIQGTMTTSHMSDALQAWGFNSSNLIATTANANFNLRWSSPPYAIKLQQLNGSLALKFGDGKIINLSESTNSKIGLGRLLNIFSLSSIPRRLSGNFKDLSEGFNFDSVNGDFTFQNGNAETENMRIEGPIASVSIKGRIGLAAKDLNLRMGVTAHVTGSLPLVAAFAGGPVVGIATLMVDKVVTQGMSSVTTYNYNVTGSWANPVWQKSGG
jgi:uncharacterized protein (TIGR02099 family)